MHNPKRPVSETLLKQPASCAYSQPNFCPYDAVADYMSTLARKNPAALALGALVRKADGKARAEKLSPARRKAIGKAAATARWGKKRSS